MWRCFDCGKEFKGSKELTELINSGGICIACGSKDVIFEGLQNAIMEHQNCHCYIMPVNPKIESTPLSFDDLEINEMCLIDLGLPLGHLTSLEDSVPAITYYTEMTGRFLHTFLEELVLA